MKIELTAIQAKVLFNICDGQADAGACKGGNTPQEQRALNEVMTKLLKHHADWKSANIGNME